MHRSAFTVGFKNGLTEPAMLSVAPTGQIFLHQYLFSRRLARTAITGIAQSSRMIGIILPVRDVHALRLNIPRVVIPMGQMAQKTGNLKIAEPIRENAKIPLAKLACLFPKTFPTGQLGQATKRFEFEPSILVAEEASCFFLFCCARSTLLASILGIHFATALSKLSIMVPTGHTQLQKMFPKRKIGTRNSNKAVIVGRICATSTYPVNRA